MAILTTVRRLPRPGPFLTGPEAQIPQPHFDESTLIAMQQHLVQQNAFAQIPDVVKAVRVQ